MKMKMQEIRDEMTRNQTEIWEQFDSNKPSRLFHYTSPQGLRGILASKTIWCTDIRHVNDSREGDHGMDIIRAALARKSVPKNFVEWLHKPEYFRGLFNLKHSFTAYIACFSTVPGGADMWNDYAAGGQGYSIVFDYDKLAAGQNEGKSYALFRVLYEREKQLRNAELTISHGLHLLRQLEPTPDERHHYWFREMPFALMNCGLRFKDPKWHREQEIRIYIAGGDNAKPFTAPDGRPRIAVPFDQSAVSQIVRGPAAELKCNEISELLKGYGYRGDVQIVEQLP